MNARISEVKLKSKTGMAVWQGLKNWCNFKRLRKIGKSDKRGLGKQKPLSIKGN